MKTGDKVQVRQVEVIPENHVSDPPIPSGRLDHWIYGSVVSSDADTVIVRIFHPRNRQNRKTVTVPLADVRTKADVLAAITVPKLHPKIKAGLERQAARLT